MSSKDRILNHRTHVILKTLESNYSYPYSFQEPTSSIILYISKKNGTVATMLC